MTYLVCHVVASIFLSPPYRVNTFIMDMPFISFSPSNPLTVVSLLLTKLFPFRTLQDVAHHRMHVTAINIIRPWSVIIERLLKKIRQLHPQAEGTGPCVMIARHRQLSVLQSTYLGG